MRARRRSPGGRIAVVVEPAPEVLRISIRDTGCGILPQDLPKVMEPFFTTRPHGNGLGLPICRAILWEIGGAITLDSDPGVGTHGGADAPAGGATFSGPGVMTGSRILVVDDEPGILRAVERVLGDTHHVRGTSSSKDAVSLAAEFLPELAIVDIRMPEVDGFELMARLKTRLPQSRRDPDDGQRR